MWCLNLETGDKFTHKKWKAYYATDETDYVNPIRHGLFYEGTVVGCLVDLDRGTVNFFKDGIDLGPAFIDKKLKNGNALYPFV